MYAQWYEGIILQVGGENSGQMALVIKLVIKLIMTSSRESWPVINTKS